MGGWNGGWWEIGGRVDWRVVGGSWDGWGLPWGSSRVATGISGTGSYFIASEKSGLFSSCKGPVGIPLESLPGNSGSLSCCLREVKSPFKLQGRARECSGVMAGESGLNSHGRGNLKVFLELRQEVWVSSSCHRDLREPLMLSLGSQESFRVVRGLSRFLSSWCGRLGPHLELRRETQCSSSVLTGILGSL